MYYLSLSSSSVHLDNKWPNRDSDILRRVSIVIHQHISKCEQRLATVTPDTSESGLFYTSKMKAFDESHFLSPQYVYHFVRAPVSRMGFLFGIKKHEAPIRVPDLSDIHIFVRELFVKAQLTAECSIGKQARDPRKIVIFY